MSTTDREQAVTEAFVGLASSLATGYDANDLLGDLTERCTALLDIASAGLLLADGLGVLHVLAASTEDARQLEVFQLQRDEGPCRDCFHTGEAVSVPVLDDEEERWPQFVPAARSHGFASVHALPMRLRDRTLGALNLFHTEVGALDPRDLSLGQALADVASVALVQDRAASDRDTVNEQLQHALTSRVTIEQAKGVLAQYAGIEMAQAFAILRHYARDNNERLSVVAAGVVGRTLSPERVVAHAAARGRRG